MSTPRQHSYQPFFLVRQGRARHSGGRCGRAAQDFQPLAYTQYHQSTGAERENLDWLTERTELLSELWADIAEAYPEKARSLTGPQPSGLLLGRSERPTLGDWAVLRVGSLATREIGSSSIRGTWPVGVGCGARCGRPARWRR
jgi:hypothetical protein